MTGYGILFRGVHQAVQGTALGVAVIFGVGETAPLYAREREIVQAAPYATLRQSTAMARVLSIQEGRPLDEVQAEFADMAPTPNSDALILTASIAPGLVEARAPIAAPDADAKTAKPAPLVIDWNAPIAPSVASANAATGKARTVVPLKTSVIPAAAIDEALAELKVDVERAFWLGDADVRRQAVMAHTAAVLATRGAGCADCLAPKAAKVAGKRTASASRPSAAPRSRKAATRGSPSHVAAKAVPSDLKPSLAVRFGPPATITAFDLPALPADMVNLACVVAAQNRMGPPCFAIGGGQRVGRKAAAGMRKFPAFDGDVSTAPWLGDAGSRRAALEGRPDASKLGMASAEPEYGEEGLADTGADGPTGIDGADGQASETDLLSIETLPRGGLAFSGGYSSLEGPVGTVKIARTNIGAPGRDITASARYSKIQRLFELGLADANFMGSKVSLAPTFFYSRSTAVGFDAQSKSSVFRQTARGVNFYAGKPLARGLRVAANYRYSDEDFLIRQKNARCDVGLHGSPFCNALGRSTSSVLSVGLVLDRRDRAVDPTRGFQLRLTPEIAGPGGTSRYARIRVSGNFHHRIGDMFDVSLGLEGGMMESIGGRTIPLFDRFYIGGNSMRGFDLRGIGPKVVPLKAPVAPPTAIGGRAYYVGRLEVAFRVEGAMQKFGVSPSVFVDAGSVFGASKSELIAGERLIGNSAKPRVAVGFGLAFNAGPGKLRFNIAQPVVRQDGDRSKKFSISLGTAF
ncbi:MAG: BamA/TamA family outer membrane protein [Sphingopyxis sp.]|uniref:BamA/TamA family outer membrane protein n=1 Tax=Sphingopyxis sp. TaxID=1908224 RepID=UPI001A39BB74|nr:BamA/TamA family outer membrane protein [Sphingopyxis sp.]MBL9066794.1 BamA/TamA family outer membrane protein [Sphingopyxis sp.]